MTRLDLVAATFPSLLWNAQDYPREMVFMDSYTPMTSANTTPATTPGSTPPSGAEAYHQLVSSGGKSPAMVSHQGMDARAVQ